MPRGVVDAWLVPLDAPLDEIERLHRLLDRAERARASAFRFNRDRWRFIARRGRMRMMLSEYLSCRPVDIRFRENPQGKLDVIDGGALRFNISHSDGLCLCVITNGMEIGCDLERRDADLASADVARRLFAPAEWATLEALPEHQWLQGFYNCWTRKEAFIKAIGLGLSHPLNAFEVTLAPGEPARLLRGGDGWMLHSFDLAPSFQAAICVDDPDARINWPRGRHLPSSVASVRARPSGSA